MELIKIVSQFSVPEEIQEVAPLGTGLINDTYKVKTLPESAPDYVLQRINHYVFRDVALMQNNIQRVTDHIRKKLKERGETNLERKTLTIIPARDGKLFYFDGENYWRLTLFIKDSQSFEQVTPALANQTGAAFGDF